MHSLSLFRGLGVFVREEFLAQTVCRALCTQMRAATARPAEVLGTSSAVVDRVIRRTSDAQIDGAAADDAHARIEALSLPLASHFRIDLGACEDISFLVYGVGDFYRPHRDRAARAGDFVEDARSRRVSVVLFLNDGFSGGALTLYGLVDDPKTRAHGFAIPPAPGLLIAFASDLVHEVTPVTAGERFTAVSWFHG